SIMCALVLTPALCATMLKPIEKGQHAHAGGWLGRFFDGFNNYFERFRAWYRRVLAWVLDRTKTTMLVYGVIVIAMAVLLYRLPTGYLPDEDQGFFINFIALPPGTEQSRTMEVAHQVADYFTSKEKKNVGAVFTAAGFNPIVGMGQNAGVAFTKLVDWSKRPGAQNSATAIARRASAAFMRIPDAQVFAVVPPSVPELGFSTGFDLELE